MPQSQKTHCVEHSNHLTKRHVPGALARAFQERTASLYALRSHAPDGCAATTRTGNRWLAGRSKAISTTARKLFRGKPQRIDFNQIVHQVRHSNGPPVERSVHVVNVEGKRFEYRGDQEPFRNCSHHHGYALVGASLLRRETKQSVCGGPMSAEPKPVIRCAIYTRKSCEEGLEQSFKFSRRSKGGLPGIRHQPTTGRLARSRDSS
jgi:hypothetical protein